MCATVKEPVMVMKLTAILAPDNAKEGVLNIFSKLVQGHYRLHSWFQARKFKSLSKSVRYINGKIKKRMVDEKEREHEQHMDQASLNGIRQDFRGGKKEPSEAPPNSGGRGMRPGRVRGIQKPEFKTRAGTPHGRQDFRPRTPISPAEKSALDAAYAAEKALPKGRFWHVPGPYCFNGPDGKCQGRICQGCGYHSSPDNPGHERPRCRHKGLPDFVECPKYWCDVWPGRTRPLGSRNNKDGAKGDSTPSATGRANGVQDSAPRSSSTS